MLSIIIPTLNEEEYLPLLLDSIRKQDFSGYEIIVADAGSKDATIEIAKKYNCIITEGGLPARARNNGARVAKGDVLLFLDADVILPDDFFKNYTKEYQERGLAVAGFFLHPYPFRKFSYFLVNTFYNFMVLALEHILPHGAMAMVFRADIFNRIKGFDETITLAEDHDAIRRAAKLGKYGIIKSTRVWFSERRFVKDGWITTGWRYFLCGLYNIFIGPVRSDIFNYKFNHYKEKK